jgi:HD-GYP domain-containing protein (c-di-GMP phosphodiesterase class II)
MALPGERIEDVRAASLLHDIGKLQISRELLYKAARFTREEFEEMQSHVDEGIAILETVGGSLRRVIPIVLAHHDKFNGSGYHPTEGQSIPLEARIISVADVYDSITSDRPYRKAMSLFEARDVITKGSGTDFDPRVVDAFLEAFRGGELEVPAVIV